MKFAHLTDTHLGYRQYGLIEREEDFYKVFRDIVANIISEKPDFVIHSGDLFEFSKPSPNTLLVSQEQLLKLNEANIPVYAIAGNHDILMRKKAIPPQVLFKNLGLNLITPKNQYFTFDDVFIGGTPYHSKLQADSLKDTLNSLSEKAEEFSKRILIIHQGIDKYLPWEYELELADLPKNFDYYACGHVHNRIVDDFAKGKLVYPGSTEIWKANELGDYLKKKKGFYLVEMNNDEIDVKAIDINLPREFISKTIQYPQLNKELYDLKDHIYKSYNKPIVNLTVEGGNFNRGDVYEQINNILADYCLKIRPTFKSEDIVNDEKLIEDITTLEPKELLSEKLKSFDNEDITNLGIGLFDNLSKDKTEESEKIVDNFYKDYFENISISDVDLDFDISDIDVSDLDLDISDLDVSNPDLDISDYESDFTNLTDSSTKNSDNLDNFIFEDKKNDDENSDHSSLDDENSDGSSLDNRNLDSSSLDDGNLNSSSLDDENSDGLDDTNLNESNFKHDFDKFNGDLENKSKHKSKPNDKNDKDFSNK